MSRQNEEGLAEKQFNELKKEMKYRKELHISESENIQEKKNEKECKKIKSYQIRDREINDFITLQRENYEIESDDYEDEDEEEDFEDDDDENSDSLDQPMTEFKKAILEHKMNLKFEKENTKDEVNIIISEIYRKHFAKSIENPCDKYITNATIYKKNLEKELSYQSNLNLLKILFEKIGECFNGFRDKIVGNPAYKILKVKLKELVLNKVSDSAKKKNFWVEHKNKICGIFNDINIVYKTVIKASSDIDHIFHHILNVISKERNITFKIENLQRDRIKEILFQNDFIHLLIKEIFKQSQDEYNYIHICREILTKISEDIEKSEDEYSKLTNLLDTDENIIPIIMQNFNSNTNEDTEDSSKKVSSDFDDSHSDNKSVECQKITPQKPSGKSVEELYEYIMGNNETEKKNNNKKKKGMKQKGDKKNKLNNNAKENVNNNNSNNINYNNNTNNTNSSNNAQLNKVNYSDEHENDKEVEEFKRKLQDDSIHAISIKKIKPVFTQDWINDMN